MTQFYAHPSNARRAARAALGKGAVEGTDYRLTTKGKQVGFEPIETGDTLERLIKLLERPQGATALEVGAAFGWLEHTSRARISTGPRTRGYKVVRTREDGRGSVYRAEKQLPLGESRKALGNRYEGGKRKRQAKREKGSR
jgi:hypothetical protein